MNLSDEKSNCTNNYLESEEIWLDGVIWRLENCLPTNFSKKNMKNSIDKILEIFTNTV